MLRSMIQHRRHLIERRGRTVEGYMTLFDSALLGRTLGATIYESDQRALLVLEKELKAAKDSLFSGRVGVHQ